MSQHLQEVARAFRDAGPMLAMPETLRERSLPLSVRAATPRSVTFVQRLSETTCTHAAELPFRIPIYSQINLSSDHALPDLRCNLLPMQRETVIWEMPHA